MPATSRIFCIGITKTFEKMNKNNELFERVYEIYGLPFVKNISQRIVQRYYDDIKSKLPEFFDAYRGTSIKEYENIITNKTPPGKWWTVSIRKALHYATFSYVKAGQEERGIVIMRHFCKTDIETITPAYEEFEIFQHTYPNNTFEFVPISEVIDFIANTWMIKDSKARDLLRKEAQDE